MNGISLRDVELLVRQVGHVFIATADPEGFPHIAAAERAHVISDRELSVTGWFCSQTEANLARNPRAAIVVWDPGFDHGYQVIGMREREEEIAIMDGYATGLEDEGGYPQVERELLLRVDRILEFHHAQHNDEEKERT